MSTIAAPPASAAEATHAPATPGGGATPGGRPRVHSTWQFSAIIALAAAAVVTIVLLAFAWPSYTSKAQNMPVAVAGTGQAATQIQSRLSQSGTFAAEHEADREGVVDAIRRDDVYGGIVVSRSRIEVLTSSAGSSVAAQALNGVAQGLSAQVAKTGQQVVVTDVVPLSSDDPRGAVLGIAALPMAMGGMIGGVLISMLVVGHWRRAASIALYSVVAGLLLTLILDPWFGALQGNFALEWLAIGLAMMATAALIVGLHGLIGPPGIAIGAVVTMFVGNPLSSASAPPEFLPWDWGTIGQCLVPGAGAALLRRLSYFPDASTARYWWALILWAVVGGALLLFGQFRDQQVLRLALGTEPDRPHAPREHRVRESRSVGDEDGRADTREAAYDDEAYREPRTAPLPVGAAAPARHIASEESGLRGTVTASGGVPVPGATITLADEAGRQLGRTVSDPAGEYRLPSATGATGLLIVTAAGLAPFAERVVVAGALHHDIALSGRSTVYGRVRRADGAGRELGVDGAVVTVTDGAGRVVASATTAVDGAFVVRGLSGGPHVLTAQQGTQLDVRSLDVPDSGDVACDPVLSGGV